MPLSRQQIAQIFATDAERYKQKKEEDLTALGKTTPYAGLEKLTNIGVGAITGGMTGGLGGAVMGGISGSNADNPIEAGVGGASMGTGLTDITSVTPQMNIPGGVSGEVANTVGKTQDLGQLFRPENMNKTAELYKGMTGEQSGPDMMSKIGTINKDALKIKTDKQDKIDAENRKQQNAIDLANVKKENKPAKPVKPVKPVKPTTPKVDTEVKRTNFISATTKLDQVFSMTDTTKIPELLAKIKARANELYQKGELDKADYNAIMTRIKEGQ